MNRELNKILTNYYTIQNSNEIDRLPTWARQEKIYNCERANTHTHCLFSLNKINRCAYTFRSKAANMLYYLAKVIAPTEQLQ